MPWNVTVCAHIGGLAFECCWRAEPELWPTVCLNSFVSREAFAAWLPPFGVPLSYAIAVGYVFTDTGDKFFKAYKEADKELGSMAGLDSAVDTGKWVCC